MTRVKKRKPTFTERVSLGLRVSPHIKEKLDEAAKQSGRSQSTEAAYRLERSFERQDLLADVLTTAFHSKKIAGIILFSALLFDRTGSWAERAKGPIDLNEPSDTWLAEPYAYAQAVQAVLAALEACRPPGEVKVPDGQKTVVSDFGRHVALAIMHGFKEGKPVGELQRQAHALLGKMTERLPDLDALSDDALTQSLKDYLSVLTTMQDGPNRVAAILEEARKQNELRRPAAMRKGDKP